MSIPINDWISHYAKFSPEQEAMYDLASGRRFTYAQFHERIDQAALYLRDGLGVEEGDRVAVLSFNDSDVFELQFACQRIGAIFLPLNWRLTVPELEYICNDATPKALLYSVEFEANATEVQRLAGIQHSASLKNGSESDYETGLAAADGTLEPLSRDLTDIWTIMYTSGTTGRPKGAKLTYQHTVFHSIHCATTLAINNRSKSLVFLPIFHTSGLNVFTNPIFHAGGTNVILRTFEPSVFLNLLADKELHLTHLLGVPTIYQMVAQEPGFATADLSHLVHFSVAGSAVPPSLIEVYGAKNIRLQQAWGMTEAGPLGTIISADEALSRIGSAGLPPMYMSVKICDGADNEVTPGEIGELFVKGAAVTPGYWNREDEHDQYFTRDGWFRTGDAARQDEDGYYYIVDRTKDMFISGGENVSPAEVEDVISQLGEVLENAVIGIADEKWGEVGCAYVVLKPGMNLDDKAIISHCQSQLATYKVPKQVRIMKELPHTATGKVLKHELSLE